MARACTLALALCILAAAAGCEEGPATSAYKQSVLQHRMERDMELRERGSVLPTAARDQFAGLDYFGVDSTYRYAVPFERPAVPDTVWMAESTGGRAPHLLVGHLQVSFPEDTARLAVFRAQTGRTGTYWIPFADQTNGSETYEAGRYVDVALAGADSAVVDFNMAYNPTCAYNPSYACPLPPSENRLPLAVSAGEKKPQLH